MRTDVIQAIDSTRLIVVLRGLKADTLLSVCEALVEGGVRVAEIPFNASDRSADDTVAESVALVKERFGDELNIGCGTVLSCEQVDISRECGAGLIVAPNTDTEIIKKAVQAGMVCVPGAFTASEIVTADKAGADYVKLFPAAQLGEQYVKAITAPLSHVKLMMFGGIGLENYKRFLVAGAYGAGVGESLVSERFINSGNFKMITTNAKQYIRIASEI